jgi:DNA-binding winged helix-turn-helix (wHTH) protein
MKEFPPFRLDTVNQCLWRRAGADAAAADERILLTPKAFAVLCYLVEHAGRLVTLDELLGAVWPDTYVQPEILKYQISAIRNRLGDRPKDPLFIETLPRRGYRFVAEVTEGEPAAFSAEADRNRTRLAGRESELNALRACFRKALTGQRQIVFITGEPGIGKTALADEFQRQASAEEPFLRVARGQCVEGYGGAEAYYPMLDALHELCRGSEANQTIEILAARAPTWLVQFPALLKREHRQTLQREILGATRERMLREIRDALDTIASEAPLLLVFEDLQWIDPSTVDLISALARQRTSAKIMLIATKRPLDMLVPEHPLMALKQDLLLHHLCEEIALAPLGEAAIAEYLGAETPDGHSPDSFAGLIHRHSEGNPLFMVALLDHMTERGLISRESGKWRLRVPLGAIDLKVPETLRQMIEAQIDRLTIEEQRTLEAASVAGASFAANVVARAMNVDAELLEELFERLSRRSRIVRAAGPHQFPDGSFSQRYEFVHALYREVLHRRPAPGRRAKLHLHIGERLEELFSKHETELAAELAEHFVEAGDWERAVKYLRLRAVTAARRFAHRETAMALQRSLELLNKLPSAERAASEIEVLTELAYIYAVSFETLMWAVETYETLATRAAQHGLINDQLRALVHMAYPSAWISPELYAGVVERALVLAEGQRDAFRRARAQAANLVRLMGAAPSSSRDAEECRNVLADIRTAGDSLVLASLLGDYCTKECDPLDSWAAVTFTSDRGRCRYMHLLFGGEWAEALREAEAGIALVDQNRHHENAQTLRLCQAWVHLFAMDFHGVRAICEPLLTSPWLTVHSATLRFCLVLAGSAELALGNDRQALQHLLAVEEDMTRHVVIWDWYWRMVLESALTDAWVRVGDFPKARSHAEAFVNVTHASGDPTWQALAQEAKARIAIAEGDLQGALACIVSALASVENFDIPLAAWRVHDTAAQLYGRMENMDLAERHHELCRATILKLANSLAPDDPLRNTFLTAAPVRKILDGFTKVTLVQAQGQG